MSVSAMPDLVQFRDFINERLAAGATRLTPEQALDEYLVSLDSPTERAECVEAVRESLAEIRAGKSGRLASEYLAEVRARHRLGS